MKLFVSLVILFLSIWAVSQVSISSDNTSPDPSAMLDIQSTDKENEQLRAELNLIRDLLAQKQAYSESSIHSKEKTS